MNDSLRREHGGKSDLFRGGNNKARIHSAVVVSPAPCIVDKIVVNCGATVVLCRTTATDSLIAG